MNLILLSLFLLIFQAQATDSFSPNIVFRLISYVTKLVPFMIDIKEFVEDVINPTDNVDTQLLAVIENLQRVQHQIRELFSDLHVSVDFNPYLFRIASAQSAISNVNEDFVKFQKASNENNRNHMRTMFIENYKSNLVDTYLWELRERAKGTPILSQYAMPPLLAIKLKCNMTAVTLFQRGYLSLMMNGYALKSIYANMTGGDAESEVNDWIVYMNGSVSGLLTADKTCMNNYPEYAIKDLEGIDSVQTLHKTVQEKYPWLEASIATYYPVRGYRYHAVYANYSRTKNVFLKMTKSENKVMAFCEKKGKGTATHETKVKIHQEISTYKRARTGHSDSETATHILDSILEITRSLGSYPYAIIILADHPDFPIKESVTGYCANEVHFKINYDTVYEHSVWFWEQRIYSNVKYHVHIYLPTQVIDQPTNGFIHTYIVQVSAFYKVKASTPLLILLAIFYSLYFSAWQYK